MTVETKVIKAKQHPRLAAIIHRDAQVILERWAARSVEEQPQARRVHHVALLDHLSLFLSALSESLRKAGPSDAHAAPARRHGEQRWEAGWSLAEVVQDYQILRLVLVDHLQQAVTRALRSHELMAIGLALDEAIASSVHTFARENERSMAEITASLQRKNEQLEAIERRRTEFLAVLGHELRNPLAPLRNAIDLLILDGKDPETVSNVTAVLDRQSMQLGRLVDDLLDFSRMAQDKMRLDFELIDLTAVVRHAIEDVRAEFVSSGLALTVVLPEESIQINGDGARLTQVITNLLNNARKFTNAGGRVAIELTFEPGAEETRLVVQDTGIGIEPDLLSSLFDTFSQGRESLTQGRSGLGLGLAIVKRLVELHGGTISAASEGPGRGAEFVVRLPLLR
jgi:signal transduction histidine kinase